MRHLLVHARAAVLMLAVLTGSAFLAGSASAQGETPTPVNVTVEFTDNACMGTEYLEPTMDAPQFAGTSQEITGTVAPGETVEVTYTAHEGYVVEGQSRFTHTFPAEPASVADCEQPEPLVRDRSTTWTGCGGVERREWEIVTAYVWDGSEWLLGEPEVRHDTGRVFVRHLTSVEQKQLGCLDVGGEQGNNNDSESEVAPIVEVAPAQETVPTTVDAGLTDAAVAPAAPRWLAPLLGGVVMLGLAASAWLKRWDNNRADRF